jgi:hypothetical protein
MTGIGFFSAVCPRTDGGRGLGLETDRMMVRARVRSHLEALQERFVDLRDAEMIETAHADYRFRIIVSKDAWADAVREMVMEQDYGNFKNAAATAQGNDGDDYVHALHRVWSIMSDLQHQTARRRQTGDRFE